ncbi:MAG: Eco57I restriction-modification methylase domain-containing protein [Chloroflexi bacterium]|nr:Eco57I restriction-modification methylase domain-containing protein [Chloroflexota bacterium]
MLTFDQSRAQIASLVKHYLTNREAYHAPRYKEAEARRELIDPLFTALGWDVLNVERRAPQYKPVMTEVSLEIDASQRAPDYAFRMSEHDIKFYVEAKKPGVALKTNADAAFQLRRYGWNGKLALSILTDFEEFAVYDCRSKPKPGDKPSVARKQYYTFPQYADEWRALWDLFSFEAVRGGAFDQFAQSETGKRGSVTVDADFLDTIEGWRRALAQNIELRNSLSADDLTDAVQRTIDRLIFLRIAEDRDIEPYGQLRELAARDGIYPALVALFRKADRKYNSGLFDFARDRAVLKLEIDDRVLKALIGELYGTYNFRLMPPEILGNVYEQFLGKVIRVTAGGHAKIEEKPEVRKAGGVYYTPSYIVDYIVRQTLGRRLDGRTPKEASALRVLDMACGSGSFLLGAYRFLLDWHRDWYAAHEPAKQKPLYDATHGAGTPDWRLTTAEKKRILLNNIYGVDIDRQAVEVTKLSLLLTVLEDESRETLQPQLLDGDGERALPNLDANIRWGNSLIGPDYADDPAAREAVRAFDWRAEFPAVMKAGGFDVVIGNPPYVRIQTMTEYAPREVEAYKRLYRAAGSGNYDVYVVFVERALGLLNATGTLGFILPHKFFNAKYGAPLRGVLSEGKHLRHVVHFGDQQVFAGATTYTCLMFLDKAGADAAHIVKVDDLNAWRLNGAGVAGDVPAASITGAEWNFTVGAGAALFERLSRMPVKLGDVAHIFVGTQTSADDVFVLEDCRLSGQLIEGASKNLDRVVRVESEATVPFLRGSDIRRYQQPVSTTRLISPYETTDSVSRLYSPTEMAKRFPKTLDYLALNRSILAAREKGKFTGANWYAFGYPKSMTLFRRPKIIVPDYNNVASFTYDESGYFFKTGYGVLLKSDDLSSFYVLGLLNSPLLFSYLSIIGTHLRGGYVRFWTQFIAQLPIRPIDFADANDKARHDRMVTLVTQMLDLHKRQAAAGSQAARDLIATQIAATDRQIDALVYELYGLADEEIAVVEG